MKFFILVFIPLILAGCLAAVGWMILGLKGALAGGFAGIILLILGLIIYLKDRKSGGESSASSAPAGKTTFRKEKETSEPTEVTKVKIKKPKKADKRVLGILKNAQALLKEVKLDQEEGCLLVDAAIVPTTPDGAFAPWFPDEMSFQGFATQADAEKGVGGQKINILGWRRWMQNEFRIMELELLRGSCRLQYTVAPVSSGVGFIRFSYEDECFGKPIILPETAEVTPSDESAPVNSVEDAPVVEEMAMEEQEPGEILVFVLRNGQQTGPFTMGDLWVEISEHRVFLTDYGWYEGLPDWLPLSKLIEHDKDSI